MTYTTNSSAYSTSSYHVVSYGNQSYSRSVYSPKKTSGVCTCMGTGVCNGTCRSY